MSSIESFTAPPSFDRSQIVPLFVQFFKIVLALQTQPRSQICVRILFLCCPAITKESKAVLALFVGVLEVLPLWLSQNPRQMRSATGPDTVNASSRPSAIVPGAAIAAHVGSGEESIAVGDKVICGSLGRCDGSDTLRRHLAKRLRNVRSLYLSSMRHSARSTWRMRPYAIVSDAGQEYFKADCAHQGCMHNSGSWV